MDYEQLYKDALERAKEDISSGILARRETARYIFPELRESSEEMVRRTIISTLYRDDYLSTEEVNECVAWLEKQSKENMIEALRLEYEKGKADTLQEQRKEWNEEDERIRKSIIELVEWVKEQQIHTDHNTDGTKWDDMIAWLEKQDEPFDDNIITRDDEILQAISVGLTDMEEDFGWSDFGGLPIKEIQDWLEKQGGKTNPYSGVSFEYNGHIWGMCARDNGVEIWLDEKLLKHLEKQETSYTKKDVDDAYVEGMAFAKDELEKQNKQILANSATTCKDEHKLSNLESIGEKWSEEDKKKLNRIYQLIAEAADEHAFSTTCRLIGDKECVELQDFLQSLKPQPKQEWSEEDEFCLNTILNIFEQLKSQSFYGEDDTAEKCINFLRHKLNR